MILKKLWVDDIREAPDHTWEVARTFHDAVYMLDHFDYDAVSLDNDLGEESFYGNCPMEGYDILQWLIFRKMNGKHAPMIVRCHSANPVRSHDMLQDIGKYFS